MNWQSRQTVIDKTTLGQPSVDESTFSHFHLSLTLPQLWAYSKNFWFLVKIQPSRAKQKRDANFIMSRTFLACRPCVWDGVWQSVTLSYSPSFEARELKFCKHTAIKVTNQILKFCLWPEIWGFCKLGLKYYAQKNLRPFFQPKTLISQPPE